MTGDEVRVAFRKYDGRLHWHYTLRYLGEDAHGTWLGAPAGVVARIGADGPPVVQPHPQVLLVPVDRWWMASFNGPPSPVEVYCDITTPPAWPRAAEVTAVDLDLDVVREREDGRVFLDDEDEFAEHRVRFGYPEDVVAGAEAAAWHLMWAVAAREEPFGTGYRRWLSLVS